MANFVTVEFCVHFPARRNPKSRIPNRKSEIRNSKFPLARVPGIGLLNRTFKSWAERHEVRFLRGPPKTFSISDCRFQIERYPNVKSEIVNLKSSIGMAV